jgi:hypothetical protein
MDATSDSPAPIADLTVDGSIDPTPKAGSLSTKLTRADILSKLQTLGYRKSIPTKTTVPQIRSLLE